MEIDFKFKVGDIVQHAALASWNAEIQAQNDDVQSVWAAMRNSPQRWFIVERQSQECPGGVQKHYIARGVSRDSSLTKDYFKFNEIELMIISAK